MYVYIITYIYIRIASLHASRMSIYILLDFFLYTPPHEGFGKCGMTERGDTRDSTKRRILLPATLDESIISLISLSLSEYTYSYVIFIK